MTSPVYDLGTKSITTPLTSSIITAGVSAAGVAQNFLDGFGGIAGLTIEANFTAGTGGTSVIAVVRTALGDDNWIEIARFDFATTSVMKVCNLSGLDTVAVSTVALLGANAVLNGILGDRFQAYLTTTGTYASNAAIAIRIAPR